MSGEWNEAGVTKMELLLWRKSTTLRRMADGTGNVEIWRARLEEADAAYCLVREYFEVAGVMVREDQKKFVEQYFGDGQGLWLARAEEQVAGCVGLRRLPGRQEREPEDVKCAEIKRMYVRERYRGQGIAARLLEAVENFARQTGYAWIYLDTASNMAAAARLYERNGFVRCERYNENLQAAIFMRKSL
jgi:ribosomal protein S18 acetylase RimI-like enzyme